MKTLFTFLIFLFALTGFSQTKNEKKAVQYHKAKNYNMAIKFYSKELKKHPGKINPRYNRAICYSALGKLEKAISDCEKVDVVILHDVDLKMMLAELYNLNKQYLKAGSYYEKAMNLGQKKTAELYAKMGTSYFFGGNYSKSEKYLTRCLELDPKHSIATNNLGWSVIDKDPKRACELFKVAFELDSTSVNNVNNLAYAYILTDELENGFKCLQKAEKMDPSNSFIYRNYGLYYMRKGDKKSARSYLKKAIKNNFVENFGERYLEELRLYCESDD